MKHHDLAGLEYAALAHLSDQNEGLYGLQVQSALGQSGRPTTAGAAYKALAKLEQRGLACSEWGEPTSKPGGRRKRTYRITDEGRITFANARQDRDAPIWTGE